MINGYSPDANVDLPPHVAALIARRQKVMGSAYRLFYESPVELVRGKGVWLYDSLGRAYLDMYNNVSCVGHSHPAVVEAIARQAGQLNTHTRYLNESVVGYAERLVSTFPAALSNVMFTCTGSEANDLALRIAKKCARGSGIIVTENAYHGVTAALARISPSLGSGVPLGSDVRTVAVGKTPAERLQFADRVQLAADDLKRHGIQPAALILDTIFSSDGVYADPPGFLVPAVEVIRREGGIFIADEVQPGFGRTGEAMWGFSRHRLVPDLVTIGKPMGNGYPIAGVVGSSTLMDEFGHAVRYFNTYGGTPVACAAGAAVLTVIENEGLVENARRVGSLLEQGLRELARQYDLIGEIRGAGLFIGVDVVDGVTRSPSPALASCIVNLLRQNGMLISASGPAGHVLKIRPPLVLKEEEAAMFISALRGILHSLKQNGTPAMANGGLA
jgi:4-aminobutyrate aminotransferase-like enzyme